MSPYWIEIIQLKPGSIYRYKTHTENPINHSPSGGVSADLTAIYTVDAYSSDDAVCRVMLGNGSLVV